MLSQNSCAYRELTNILDTALARAQRYRLRPPSYEIGPQAGA
jgi:hypothetical protein